MSLDEVVVELQVDLQKIAAGCDCYMPAHEGRFGSRSAEVQQAAEVVVVAGSNRSAFDTHLLGQLAVMTETY